MTEDSSLFDGRRWHDMGGDPAGSIDREGHDYALWERRVDALMCLCSDKGLMNVDSLRRALEDLGPDAFETMTYYERWVAAVAQNMVEAGVVSQSELAARMEVVAARGDTYGEATRG